MLDLFDRKAIVWLMSTAMATDETVMPTWQMALYNKPIINELLFHSDRVV